MLRIYGVSGLKAHIRKHVKLGETFHTLVQSRSDLFSVPTPPAFALTVLTIVPRFSAPEGRTNSGPMEPDISDNSLQDNTVQQTADDQLKQANFLTNEVYRCINSQGEIFLTSGVVNGITAIRVVSANPLAEEKYIHKAFKILVKTAEGVVADYHAQRGVDR